MNALERHNLQAWLRWCEAHPDAWAHGEVAIPPAEVGMTAVEVEALFGRPTLAEVRRAVEELSRQDSDLDEVGALRDVTRIADELAVAMRRLEDKPETTP